jgi:cell wall-associated NlpC family hydrolase
VVGLVLAAVVATGCAGTGASTRTAGGPGSERSWSDSTVETRLRAASDRWAGVPHEWGGTSRQGIDCSSLVQTVYSEAFAVSVPRTTEAQADVGTRVSRRALRPGDLVFFLPSRGKPHVGIYLSDGEFVHASSSRGVTVSNLDRSYWTDAWWQARRVLQGPAPASDSAASSPASGQRSGW